MALIDICNYLPISDQLATSGQPTPEQFSDIKTAGYQVIVNLAVPGSTNWNPNEPELVRSQQLIYHHIPVIWEQPTVDNFTALCQVLEKSGPIWVHCALNMRVSAMVYLYHRLQGMDNTTALGYMTPIWQPNAIWQTFIQQVLQDPPKISA